MDNIKVIESFITWQGEGPDIGKRMLLLRFKTCDRVENKNPCSWCDTIIKMRCSIEQEVSLQTIQETLDKNKAGLMITGGEPTFGENLKNTTRLLNLYYNVANIETNGFDLLGLFKIISNIDKNIKIIWSPKIFSNKDYVDFQVKVSELNSYKNDVYLKFVIDNKNFPEDNLRVEKCLQFILDNPKIKFDIDKVYLMPEGKTREDLIKNSEICFDMCEKWNCSFSSRDQIIYGFV